MKFASLAIGALIGLMTKTTEAKRDADLVKSLPQMETFTYGVYSGFFPIEGTTKNIYYLLTESQGDWTKDPLMIWSNGGPGCSSLLGWLTENGDYLMPDNSTDLVKNPYAWNLNATILYLDHPAGVGFSTCTGDDCKANDTSDALDNLSVLKSFYAAFPEYK